MKNFSRILVPTDFGEASKLAVEAALSLAKKFDASVILLHATWVPLYVYGMEGVAFPVEPIAVAGDKALAEALAEAKEQWPRVEGVTTAGEAWEVILDTAAARECDLIVMGTHGRRWLSRVVLGSVAEKVVRLSPIPVLTISGKGGVAARKEATSAPR